jgi:hypothetical protein
MDYAAHHAPSLFDGMSYSVVIGGVGFALVHVAVVLALFRK